MIEFGHPSTKKETKDGKREKELHAVSPNWGEVARLLLLTSHRSSYNLQKQKSGEIYIYIYVDLLGMKREQNETKGRKEIHISRFSYPVLHGPGQGEISTLSFLYHP